MSFGEAKRLLKKILNIEDIFLVSRGNKAIELAFKYLKYNNKRNLLIPKEGGWITYKTADRQGLNIKEIDTSDALINLDDLRKKSKLADAFIYNNPSGYFVENNIKEVYKICRANNCLVILDASPGIGNPKQINGDFCDIMVGSFGRWKAVNLEYGGFIALKGLSYEIKEDFNGEKIKELIEKLNRLPKRLEFLYSRTEKIKKDLNNMNILHRNSKSLNVVIAFKDSHEKKNIIKYCLTEGLEFTECPRYIRVLRQAISIEVKRL